MSWWRCENCDFRYASHPSECERCGAEAFAVYEPSAKERLLRPSFVITAVGLVLLLAIVYINFL